MNKNLLALTLFALAGPALADSSLPPHATDYIGFKSNEDIGYGLKALWQLEGRLKVTDQLRLAFGYQVNGNRSEADRPTPSTGLKTREYIFSAAYTIGLFTPKFSYAQGVGVNGDNGWAMALDYALTKRTQASVSYGALKFGNNGGNDPYGEFLGAGSGLHRDSGVGFELRHRF